MNAPAKLKGYWTKFKFLSDERVIGGVNARSACYDHHIRGGMPAHRMKVGMPIFADWRQKSVTIAVSLKRSQKTVGLIMPTDICNYSENLVKISPVPCEIIGLQCDRKKKMKESNINRTLIVLWYAMPGGLNQPEYKQKGLEAAKFIV